MSKVKGQGMSRLPCMIFSTINYVEGTKLTAVPEIEMDSDLDGPIL